MFFFLHCLSFDWSSLEIDRTIFNKQCFFLLTLLFLTKPGEHSSQILWTVAFQFFKIWLRTYHSDILVSTVKVLHFTKTDFNWVLCYVFNPNESSIILFTSPQVLWRHKDYWRLNKLALNKQNRNNNNRYSSLQKVESCHGGYCCHNYPKLTTKQFPTMYSYLLPNGS